MATIDTTEMRVWLAELKGFTKQAWRAASFCRVRKDDGSWHESSKISVQRGVYGSMSPADAELAASAPRLHAAALLLIEEIEQLRAVNQRLHGQLQSRSFAEQGLSARAQPAAR